MGGGLFGLASFCNITGGERGGTCSQPPGHIIHDRSDFGVRVAVTEVGHKSSSFGDAKMGPAE